MTDANATVAPDPAPAATERSPLRWWREVLYVLAFYVVYSFVRNRFGSQGTGDDIDASIAFEHARQIIDAQKALGLYFEARLQEWYLDLPADGFIKVWNVFYGTAHFVVTAGAMVWLFRRNPARYARYRNALAATTAAALIGFASYSLMPPRLLDDPGLYGACRLYAPEAAAAAWPDDKVAEGCDRYGFVDTLVVHGGWLSFDSDGARAVTNQYAAMPSMHIGWSTWSAMVLVPMVRRRCLRGLAFAYPFLTLFTILVTANHYWLDAAGGLLALGVGCTVAFRVIPALQKRRAPAPVSA